MKIAKLSNVLRRGLLVLSFLGLALQPFKAAAVLEQTFDVLQIGTTTYRNVTVTTKSKNYIFLLHSKGMTNVKVADLPSDVRTSLGYEDPAAVPVKTNSASVWARQTMAKMEVPGVSKVEDRLGSLWHAGPWADKVRLPQLSQSVLLIAAAVLVGLFLFHSYCCLLICRKAGHEPGAAVWVPLLQLIPLLKAATMSPWWILGFLVPGLNLVAQVLWCFKITEARGKTLLVAILLILPVTSPLAAMYLAFSEGRTGKSGRNEDRRVEIMTLEAA